MPERKNCTASAEGAPLRGRRPAPRRVRSGASRPLSYCSLPTSCTASISFQPGMVLVARVTLTRLCHARGAAVSTLQNGIKIDWHVAPGGFPCPLAGGRGWMEKVFIVAGARVGEDCPAHLKRKQKL